MRRLPLFCLVVVGVMVGVVHAPRQLAAQEFPAAGPSLTKVRFDFADGGFADVHGRLVLNPVQTSGGGLRQMRREDGWAVQFPPLCEDHPESCPRAILESDRVDWLNPGTRPVKWGASVRLEPGETSDGSNVVQKGLSASGTQFKLQIDGKAGQPSCVIAGPIGGTNHIFVVLAGYGIADSQWHSLLCERGHTSLSLVVDGELVAQTTVPPNLSVHNELPLRLGGKGVGPYNDQFHGALDDVFVEIA